MSKQLFKFIKYIVVGGCTTLVNVVSYWICSSLIGFDYRIAATFAWIFAVLFAYYTNKKFVFESYTPSWREKLKEMSYFFGFRLLSFFIDLAALIIMVDVVRFNDMWAKVISNVVVLVANYIFSKWFIFKEKDAASKEDPQTLFNAKEDNFL